MPQLPRAIKGYRKDSFNSNGIAGAADAAEAADRRVHTRKLRVKINVVARGSLRRHRTWDDIQLRTVES